MAKMRWGQTSKGKLALATTGVHRQTYKACGEISLIFCAKETLVKFVETNWLISSNYLFQLTLLKT